MNLLLVIDPEAEADLAEAKAYYENLREGMGQDFLSCVEKVFDTIRATPLLFATEFHDLRVALAVPFSYLIVYRVDDIQITIIAVYHSRRDPRGWQRRA